MTVRFETVREDFPPNVEDLTIQHIVLYFVRSDGQPFAKPLTADLSFIPQGETDEVGGEASSENGVFSTRQGNAASWMPMIGGSPYGKWELALPNTEEMRNRFENEEIEDILFVITYGGETPEWPA